MDEVPEHLRRYPSGVGRQALATRLGMVIDPLSQDWEWEIADPTQFVEWLALYQRHPLSDDERFSLMEMLIQCVEDMVPDYGAPEEVEALPQWQAVRALLQANPHLHASSIAYWSVLGSDDPEERFCVSVPMRRVWTSVQNNLARPQSQVTGRKPCELSGE